MQTSNKMRVLIACEFSGIVRDAFTAMGHDATSCDLLPTEKPGKHYMGDVRDILNDGWDMMIAHPDCKYLCFSGERWITEIPGRSEQRKKAFDFFMEMVNAPIPKICIENSHSIFLNCEYRKPDQTVHPYHFGDPFKKSVCIWLKGLNPLVPTNILPEGQRKPAVWLEGPGPNRSKNRSRTYHGIAKAMANQFI